MSKLELIMRNGRVQESSHKMDNYGDWVVGMHKRN